MYIELHSYNIEKWGKDLTEKYIASNYIILSGGLTPTKMLNGTVSRYVALNYTAWEFLWFF